MFSCLKTAFKILSLSTAGQRMSYRHDRNKHVSTKACNCSIYIAKIIVINVKFVKRVS